MELGRSLIPIQSIIPPVASPAKVSVLEQHRMERVGSPPAEGPGRNLGAQRLGARARPSSQPVGASVTKARRKLGAGRGFHPLGLTGLCGMPRIFGSTPKGKALAGGSVDSKGPFVGRRASWARASSSDLRSQPGGWGEAVPTGESLGEFVSGPPVGSIACDRCPSGLRGFACEVARPGSVSAGPGLRLGGPVSPLPDGHAGTPST